MRGIVALCLTLGLALVSVPAGAQDPESLRRELDQLRQQFDAMKQQYQKAIDDLTDRLRQLESRPPAAAPPAAAAPTAPAPPAVAAAPAPVPPRGTPSLLEVARPREPFALYERRGPGQLLFDMGVSGDFVGNLTQRNVDKANAGSFPGRENRFVPREVEVALFGQVDRSARAEVRAGAGG